MHQMMNRSKQMEGRQNNSDNRDDDDVSVIAIIEKENDRPLRHQQTEKSDEKQEDRRVIELSDTRSKMALRKQLDLESLSTERENAMEDYENLEGVQKLPPGTVVFKQDRKYKDDSDYVRDSTETSSGGSTSGGGVTKVRRVYRTARKSRGTTEVRRNPIRAKKKDPDASFSRSRQRLLSAKRREMLFDSQSGKRRKSSTKPYMNTRSVTRKMYNVGATYQAPTIRDQLEWKEWPVHGMHERPVFHPKLGLAAEYLGRYFTSFDGLSYCEVIDRPEIEVVSVDPHCDFPPSSFGKKRNRKTKSGRSFTNVKDSNSPSKKNKSFESCMHESFHCVLGYCSQVMTPTYKANVEGKLDLLNENKNSFTVVKEIPKQPVMTKVVEQNSRNDLPTNSKENVHKSIGDKKMFDNYTAVMMSQNIKNLNQVPKARLLPTQKLYLTNSQKSIAFTNMKTLQEGQMKIQEIMRPSKNPFILIDASDTKDAQFPKSATSNMCTKMENTLPSEENLGELSSIYRSFDLSEELVSKQTPPKRGNKVEFAATKCHFDNVQHNKVQVSKEFNVSDKRLHYEVSNKEPDFKSSTSGLNKTWGANEASEIAKILSEYNKNSLKKPPTENNSFCTINNIRVNELCSKNENTNQNSQDNYMDRNMNITFPQGRWRRFHLTVEKLKDLKSGTNDQRFLSGIQNRQSLFRINQTVPNSTLDRRTEMSKHSETLQQGQMNTSRSVTFEKKKNTSTTNNDIDLTGTKTRSLQELLENTAMLYCAATGTHQDDLANYIDTLDAAQSVQWLETCKNFTV